MTYIDLFLYIIVNQFVKLMVLGPLTPPFPKWYNPNTHCEYHAGVPGYSIEDCTLLRMRCKS
ncbi:hypothetical protein CRYUN_Cryun17cG0054000 [Craigia yunnanensis]